MVTVRWLPFGAGAGFLGCGLAAARPVPASTSPSAAARSIERRCGSLTAASLPELLLQHLGVLEVSDERRPYLDQERLELGVGGARDQRLVDRVEDLLVVGDLVVDVGAIEGGAVQLLERREVLLATLGERLAGGVVLGR